jgi:hypothetical protein
MNKAWFVLAAMCCACSGSKSDTNTGGTAADPCIAATTLFSLTGSRFPEGVALVWGGSPQLDYEVWAFGPNHEDQFQNPVVTVSDTSADIGIPADLGTIQIEVRPVVGTSSCATTSKALTVPGAPTLTTTTTADGVQLQWTADPLYGSDAVIGRGLDANSIAGLAEASGGQYLDSAVASGTTYSYIVEMHASNLDGFSDPRTAHTLVSAPVVTATPRAADILLSWQNPTGAIFCNVVRDVPAPSITESLAVPAGGTVVSCPPQTACTYRVFCSDGINDGPPGFVSSHLAPLPPTQCMATTRQDGVSLAWSGAPADAASFALERSSDNGVTFQPVASSIAGGSYFDSAAPLFQSVVYGVRSVASDGASDPGYLCTTAPAMAVNAPDAMNLASATGSVADFKNPGQSLTVAHGGQLMGIEIARPADTPNCLFVSASGDPQADIAPACGTEKIFALGTTLAPDLLQGVYYDLSASKILVSAGETLRFQVNSNFSPGAVATSDAAGTGGATVMAGSPDPAHDLIFKAFVLPSSDLPAPQLHALAGPSAALLDWTASPAAKSYDVLDAAGAVLLSTDSTHATVPIDAAGATFSVRANGASGSATSSAQTVHATGLVPDAANLCASVQGGGRVFIDGIATIIQTFTAAHSGLLSRIELDLATDNVPLPVEIEDEQGTVLADTTISAPFANVDFQYPFPPLSTVVPAAVAIDLSAKGIHVVPGQVLQLVLHNDVFPSPTYSFRDSADAYAGGGEVGADSPRDFCFQVYIDPSR